MNFINKYNKHNLGKYSYLPPETELCQLFYNYGADKCPQISHTYSKHYFDLLHKHKLEYRNILEIGVGNKELMRQLDEEYVIGSSLKSWKDFFVNAFIYALDIRKDVLFEEERIKCFYADQSNPQSLLDAINDINIFAKNDVKFDMILDDGSHMESHQLLSLETLFKFVKPGGVYIIEDIINSNIDNFIQFGNKNNYKILKIHVGDSQPVDSFIVYEKI